ncbi:REP-associated tyrosine transposase [Pseudoflavitalea rhizosphaerae]|uniref:REP-associated tyrosine transposase n=1 Tax=Pseudoflavitalea rhizosphaerae TaxID=1884793 RepID=UPI000F8F4A60|nr:transposase [Pseudoflavitalea rhizosphaerae]
MSELRKANYDGLFFNTLTVVDWIDVFTRSIYSDLIIKNLSYCQQFKGLELFAYVIMSNHLHLISSARDGNLNELLGDFKSFSAKDIIYTIEKNEKESRKDWLLHMFRYHARFSKRHGEYAFWRPTSHAIEIRGHNMLQQKLRYVHENPVRAGYVQEPEHWVYSSACERGFLKVMEL